MNMDVLTALTARHTLEKEAALPALIAPAMALGAKALPWLGRTAWGVGKAALPYLGMGAAMEAGSAGARALTGGGGGGGEAPPQGPSGPRGPGATHGMLGFPQQEGPKGPPDFGDRHSRDRADPDIGDGGSQSSGTGFKLANAADYAAFISFRKQAGFREIGSAIGRGADAAGQLAGAGGEVAGRVVDLAGKSARAAGKGLQRAGGFVGANPRKSIVGAAALAAAYPIGKALFGKKDEEKEASIGGAADVVGQEAGRHLQGLGGKVMDSVGTHGAISDMPMGLDKAKGRVAQGLGRAGRLIGRNPRTALALAAAPALAYGAYRGAKSLFGGGGSAEEKTSAMLLGNNLIDVMAFTMERAEKEAGLHRPFEGALTVKRAAGYEFSPMNPEEYQKTQQPQQYKTHPEHPEWAFDPQLRDWVHKADIGPGAKQLVNRIKPWEGGGSLGKLLGQMDSGRDGTTVPKPAPVAPTAPTAPAVPAAPPTDQGPPGAGKGPGNWMPPPPPEPPGPPGTAKPGPGASVAPPAAGGLPGAAQPSPNHMQGYDPEPGETTGTTTAPPAGGESPTPGGVQVGTAATPGHGAGATPPTPAPAAPAALPKPTIKPTGGFSVGGKKQQPISMGV